MEVKTSLELSEATSLTEIIEALGFIESTQMIRVRNALTEGIAREEDFSQAGEYEDLAKQEGLLATPKGQIALSLVKARIFKEVGKEDIFKDEMYDVKYYIIQLADSYPDEYNPLLQAIKNFTHI